MTGPQSRRSRVSRDDVTVAAWALFEETGFEATSMTAIAERAGVSRRTLFNQVSQKTGLLYFGFDEYVAQFARLLGQRPTHEPLFTAMTATVRDLASVAEEIRARHDPGPQVRAARMRDDAVDYWRTEWAKHMAAVVLSVRGPDARMQADFVGALTAQVWTELMRLETEGAADVNTATSMVLGQLELLVRGGAPA